MLTLPIKKKWFDMIKYGEKKEEYREIKPYYDNRFLKNDIYPIMPILREMLKEEKLAIYKTILFRNGYSSKSPTIKCSVDINIGYGKEEWGAEPNKLYYVLKILNMEEMKKNES